MEMTVRASRSISARFCAIIASSSAGGAATAATVAMIIRARSVARDLITDFPLSGRQQKFTTETQRTSRKGCLQNQSSYPVLQHDIVEIHQQTDLLPT